MYTLKACDDASVQLVRAELLDSFLRAKDIRHEGECQKLEVCFARPCVSKVETERNRLLWAHLRTPLQLCRLVVEQAQAVEIADDAKIGIYTCSDLRWDAATSRVFIECVEDFCLDIQVAQLSLTLDVTDTCVAFAHSIRMFGCIEIQRSSRVHWLHSDCGGNPVTNATRRK